jgi:microcystin-dependent protein
MACSNCFNGCANTTSDKCVKYTGIDISFLGIESGDSMYSVINDITTYLLTVISGTGITPTIEPSYVCTLVDGYLPDNPTSVDLFTALIRTACQLDTDITAVEADVATIEADYTVSCLTGVTASSGTHDILQAVITLLCSVNTDIVALAVNFDNYVEVADINTYIAAYLTAISASTKHYTKMVPYTAVEYYGTLTGYFDATGAGYGDWEKIYLCNGQNGTPDKRGRIPVGATTMGNTAFNAAVDPAITGNPTYALNTLYGANTVTLSEANLASHTHVATSTVTDPTHNHYASKATDVAGVTLTSTTPIKQQGWDSDENYDYNLKGAGGAVADIGITSASSTGITVSTSNATAGSGTAHSNIPPVYGTYYIMYLP